MLIDRPVETGVADRGPTGGELLLTAVGGCFMSTLLAAIRAGEAEVSDVRTEVIGTLAESPARFSAIQLHVSVDSLDRELLEHVVEIAERTCIMMNTLRGTLDLRVQSGVPVYAPQMRARTTPGFFHKSRKSKSTGPGGISLKRN